MCYVINIVKISLLLLKLWPKIRPQIKVKHPVSLTEWVDCNPSFLYNFFLYILFALLQLLKFIIIILKYLYNIDNSELIIFPKCQKVFQSTVIRELIAIIDRKINIKLSTKQHFSTMDTIILELRRFNYNREEKRK